MVERFTLRTAWTNGVDAGTFVVRHSDYATLETELAQTRRKALEEVAGYFEVQGSQHTAIAIRALIEKEA